MKVFHFAPAWWGAGRTSVLAALVGVVSGLGAVIFFAGSEWLFHHAVGEWAGYHPRPPGGEGGEGATTRVADLVPWLLVLLPAAGGLLSGIIVFRWAPEAEGHGTDAALLAYHHRKGVIPWRVPVVKTIASILTLGTGGSAGREGPIAQIGAGFGSFLAFRLGLSARERRTLLAAGMGAGVAAIFRAPLAGALFAAEIHYRDAGFEKEVIVPSAVASIVSYCVFSLFYGTAHLFAMPAYAFRHPVELLPYGVLAICVGGAAILYVKVFYGIRELFARLSLPASVRPAIGGALTGLTALAFYWGTGNAETLSIMGFGYGVLQNALDGHIVLPVVLLLVALGKMIATGCTIGSGGSGGVFGPSMVIGGAIGGAVGLVMKTLMPDAVPDASAFVLVGMAGFFAGAAHTPISTLIMVSDMTGNYNLLLPAMWVTFIAYALAWRVGIYENQLPSVRHSPAHRGDFFHDVLAGMRVGDVPVRPETLVTFGEGTTLGEILHQVDRTHHNYFPVLDEEGRMTRIFSLNDIRPFFYEEGRWNDLRASQLGTSEIVSATPRDSLSRAIRRLTEKNIDAIPVVDPEDGGRVLQFLRRKDLIDAYNQRLRDLTQED